ncbi:hypothetical protein CGRA01v4_06800 [Colletotrichum graminicola]|nr:hypothetical protein CGRA01v4_06800 [Colletotrichum graminicola]
MQPPIRRVSLVMGATSFFFSAPAQARIRRHHPSRRLQRNLEQSRPGRSTSETPDVARISIVTACHVVVLDINPWLGGQKLDQTARIQAPLTA